MEKLSSILPASPRVKSVDMTDAHPVRPGVQSYGRPTGLSPVKDRFSLSDNATGLIAKEASKDTIINGASKDARSAKMVDDMAKRFFETRVQNPVKTNEDIGTGSSQETINRDLELIPTAPVAANSTTSSTANTTETGQNLDVIA